MMRIDSTSARRLLAGAFAASTLAITGAGVYAALNATATATTSVSTGTLKLSLSPDGSSVGLPVTISSMAPGDVQNVYINLTNTGTLASAAGMTLSTSASPSNTLSTDATKGLSVAITQCSVAWSSRACGGTTTTILSATPVANIGSAGVSLSNVPALAAAAQLAHLQFSIALPDATETTVDGTLPVGTIQGLSTTITWSFTEVQRAATVTDS